MTHECYKVTECPKNDFNIWGTRYERVGVLNGTKALMTTFDYLNG